MENTETTYFLGIDGGGSKTQAVITDQYESFVSKAVSGPSNYHRVGIKASFASLDDALAKVFLAANNSISVQNLASACLGIAGVDRPEDREIFESWIQTRLPGLPVRLTNDALPVIAAGTPAGWGVAIISGTGSIAYGLTNNGNFTRSGGWGYLFGDEGSAYSIGLAALRSAAQCADGRSAPTMLLPMILKYWKLTKPADLISSVYNTTKGRAKIAGLSPLVIKAADRLDQTAVEILSAAGYELARMARAAATIFEPGQNIPCAVAGSLLIRNQSIFDSFKKNALHLGLELNPITTVDMPVIGCVRMAVQLTG